MNNVISPFDVQEEYEINNKTFSLQTDFTYEELEWLENIFSKLQSNKEANEIQGNFSRAEINKTLKILLGKEFTDRDFKNTKEGQAVKIIADFFLSKAILGIIIKNSLMN